MIPTLVIAGAAIVLLHKEQQRLRQAGLEAVRGRASLIVSNIDLAVAEMKVSLMESLAKLPEQQLPHELRRWQESSDLVQAAISCSPAGEVRPPGGSNVSFLKTESGYCWNATMPSRQKTWGEFADSKNVRLALKGKSEYSPWGPPTESKNSWIYHDTDEGYQMGAWIQPKPGADIRILEVSLESLVKDLKKAFPASVAPTESFTLTDASGTIVHGQQSREADSAVLPVGEELPGWSVNAYHYWDKSWSSHLFWIGSLVVGLLTAGTLLGGGAVWRQARHDAAVAAQRTTFVSNVSHELKTPLTSIRMYAEILQEERVQDPAKRRKYLDVMVSESQRLTRLVNNVLDFSRLEQGRRTYSIETLAVHEVVEEALESQRFALDKAGMQVVQKVDTNLTGRADRDALERILLNLIDNAIKYAHHGKSLQIEAHREGAHLKLGVCDAGPGISERDFDRVFTRFHRINDESLTSPSGTGLGLSIARQLAVGFGGSLTCVPCQHGACFELLIPAAAESHV